MPSSRRICIFTIVSNNYLHYAKTLMQSVAQFMPQATRVVGLCDRKVPGVSDQREFETIEAECLSIPDWDRMVFQYTILELNTAIKPFVFEHLFAHRGFERVIYFDPDIRLYSSLDKMSRLLDEANILLTPHLTDRLDDGKYPDEQAMLQSGAYNLGYVAVRDSEESRKFLKWWQGKCSRDCVVDIAQGLFVDQKWIDLVPGMYQGVHIERDPGWNVAYWNLNHRQVEHDGGCFAVNGRPLVFFHFSGVAPEADLLSKHQDRFRVSNLAAAPRRLLDDYTAELQRNGADEFKRVPYAFSRLENGTVLPDFARSAVRQAFQEHAPIPNLRTQAGAEWLVDFLNQPAPAPTGAVPWCTRVTEALHRLRPDLRLAFPDMPGAHSVGFARWFVDQAGQEVNLDDAFRTPVRRALAELDNGREVGAPRPTDDGEDAEALERPTAVAKRASPKLPELGRAVNRHVYRLAWRFRHLARPWASPHFRQMIYDRLRSRAYAAPTSPMPTAAPLSLRRHETVAGADAEWKLPIGMEYCGFYVTGEVAVWMGASAKIRLPSYRPGGALRIIGEYSPDLHALASGSGVTPVDVRLNGEAAGRFVLDKPGTFDCTVALERNLDSASVIVELRPAQSFVPARIGLNEDDRRLSMRVARILFDGEAILDFADPARIASRWERQPPPAVNIVGYVRSEHGLGQSSRQFAMATQAAGIPFAMFDFNAGNASRTLDDSWAHRVSAENPHPVNIFHINADQMPLAYDLLGRDFFRGHYNVGFWHWELPELPNDYLAGFAALQEVWVPSAFVLDAVSAKAPVPVVKMPHAVQFAVDSTVTRAHMGLPEGKFLFLTMYDLHSYHERKNPEAAIAAFRKAFPTRSDVVLVVKVQNTNSCPDEFARLQEVAADSGNMLLIGKTMRREEVYNLEWLCDCFVSLHRSEGFGLGLAESMYLGKPVVGTNWSGNTEFMRPSNSFPVNYRLVQIERDVGVYKRGQWWAEPDIEHAASSMAKLVADDELRRRIARQGQQTLLTDFSPSAIGVRIERRLKLIRRMM